MIGLPPPTTASHVEELHRKHSSRAEDFAVQHALGVECVAGTGAIVYTFPDGSNVCFLGITCFQWGSEIDRRISAP